MDSMNILIFFYIFIIGCCIGSFANVCIYRIPREEKLSFPPSHCTSCGARVKAYDLVPVVSYLFLKGRCRSCSEKISLRYPAIEFLMGILYGVLYLKYGISLILLKYIVLVTLLLIIGMIDYDTTDVYLIITIIGIIFGLIFIGLGVFWGEYTIKESFIFLYGAVIGGGVIAGIIILTGGMGWGDAEIFSLCGLFLGWKQVVLLLFLSFFIGAIVGGGLMLFKKKGRKDEMAFGPFIAIATMIVLLWGNEILYWYIGLF